MADKISDKIEQATDKFISIPMDISKPEYNPAILTPVARSVCANISLSQFIKNKGIGLNIVAFSVSETGQYIVTLSNENNGLNANKKSDLQANIWRFRSTGGDGKGDSFQYIRKIDLSTYDAGAALQVSINNDGTQIALYQSTRDFNVNRPKTQEYKKSFNLFTIDYSTARLIKDQKLTSEIGFGKYITLLDNTEVFLYCDGHDITIYNTENMWFWQHWRQRHQIPLTPSKIEPLQLPLPFQLPSFITENILEPWLILANKYRQIGKQHIQNIQGKVSQVIARIPPPSAPAKHTPSREVLLCARDLVDSAGGSLFTWLGSTNNGGGAMSVWSIEFGFISAIITDANLPLDITLSNNSSGQASQTSVPYTPRIARVAPHGRFLVIAHGLVVCKYLLPSGTKVGTVDLTPRMSGYTLIDVGFPEEDAKIHISPSEVQRFAAEYNGFLAEAILILQGSNGGLYLVGLCIETGRLRSKCIKESYDPKNIPFMLYDICKNQGHVNSPGLDLLAYSQVTRSLPSGPHTLNNVVTGFPKFRQYEVRISGVGHELLVMAGIHTDLRLEYFMVWKVLVGNENELLAVVTNLVDKEGTFSTNFSVSVSNKEWEFKFGDKPKSINLDNQLLNGHIHELGFERPPLFFALYQAVNNLPAENNCQPYCKGILRYISEELAQHSTWKDCKDRFLLSLCQVVRRVEKTHTNSGINNKHLTGVNEKSNTNFDFKIAEDFEKFFNELFSDEYNLNWISSFPNCVSNPIRYGIKLARECAAYRCIRFHKTLIRHCIKNAVREGDTFFLKPVLECMNLILADERLAIEVMGQLAYIPVQKESSGYIVENSAVGERLSPLRFVPFYDQKPSLGMMDKPTFGLRGPQYLSYEDEYFKARLGNPKSKKSNYIFVAPLGILYKLIPKLAKDPKGEKHVKDIPILPEIYEKQWRAGLRFKPNELPFNSVDSPAIEALMQHRWDSHIFLWWFWRSILHGLAFLLFMILQAFPGILGRVRSDIDTMEDIPHRPWIATKIIVGILVFWIYCDHSHIFQNNILHIVNALKKPSALLFRHDTLYLSKEGVDCVLPIMLAAGIVFDYVPLIAFVNVLYQVIIIYKLRVNRFFCGFLDFAMRLIQEVILFFVIFAVGILIATYGFWYLLNGCLGICEARTTEFPSNLVDALFATFFLLGGRYDPVEAEMNSKFSMFHIGMIVYYFLMVVVIVNILTALVSVALQNSTENEKRSRHLTFLSSRLGYVIRWALVRSSNETDRAKMSFERETYYVANESEVKEFYEAYKTTMEKMMDEDDENDKKDLIYLQNFLKERFKSRQQL